ncbi:MAG: translation initiation factor IF-2 N-terminal domain-containing protein, partial [Clostridia bacterium]|nr:translation initiation factor IF-2 N-terminal domain-containing protein [Clostridia bacterium]
MVYLMVKMKVYELAKELGVESKDVIRIMKKYGYEAKSHMSTIEDSILEKVKEILSNKKGTTANAPTVQSDGAFVPRVKRIPKAQVAEEVSTVPDTTQQPAEQTKDISKTSPKNKQKSLEEEKTPIIKQTEEP